MQETNETSRAEEVNLNDHSFDLPEVEDVKASVRIHIADTSCVTCEA